LEIALLSWNPTEWPRWQVMWSVAVVVFFSVKGLTWVYRSQRVAPWWKGLGYWFAWPGLDADAFLGDSPPQRVRLGEWLFAMAKLSFGLFLTFGALQYLPVEQTYLIGWVGMVGLVFILHFGLFHLLSCFWRMIGVDAKPLMNWPILATSLSEFWGKRWNTAFRDLTHRFLFRPLLRWCDPKWALLAVFLFSGLVHDLVITLPAGGGYGGPTLFFTLQGLGLFLERSPLGKRLGLRGGWAERLFTAMVLIAPAWLLFAPPFVVGVIVPFLDLLGARG
jgi:hypothetical protein